MPAKNVVKSYLPGATYHVFNAGAANQSIFKDEQDTKTLLKFFATTLLDPSIEKYLNGNTLKDFHDRITLHAFCLMPTNYHLLLTQCGEQDMAEWIRAVMTRYAMYFNKRHNLSGALFQGVYKAALIENDDQLTAIARYIHRKPLSQRSPGDNRNWGEIIRAQPSSYENYLGATQDDWLSTEKVLFAFGATGEPSYLEFTEWDRPDLENHFHSHHQNLSLC
jgi:putative transposase